MNTQKQAMSKIAQIKREDKIELSEAQKLELATVAQIEKAAKAFDKVTDFLSKAEAKYYSIITQKGRIAKELNQFAKDFEGVGAPNNLSMMVQDVINKGKEIGVDMTQTPEIKYAMKQWDAYKEVQKELAKLSERAKQEAKNLL